MKEKTKLELNMKYLEDEVIGDSSSKLRKEEELDELQAKITQKEVQLEILRPQFEEIKARMDEAQHE